MDDFDLNRYQEEYINAADDAKDDTFLGKFFAGAISQKGMVTDEIHRSGNILAGFAKLTDMRKLG